MGLDLAGNVVKSRLYCSRWACEDVVTLVYYQVYISVVTRFPHPHERLRGASKVEESPTLLAGISAYGGCFACEWPKLLTNQLKQEQDRVAIKSFP